MDIQICKCCGFAKSLIDYEWADNRPRPRTTCKQCRYKKRDIKKENSAQKEYKKQHYLKRKHIIRQSWERAVYGASKEDIGISECIICGSIKRLCIDHCHKTGNIRGILCSKCNTGLGMFRDSPELLIKASMYLQDGPHFQLVK